MKTKRKFSRTEDAWNTYFGCLGMCAGLIVATILILLTREPLCLVVFMDVIIIAFIFVRQMNKNVLIEEEKEVV